MYSARAYVRDFNRALRLKYQVVQKKYAPQKRQDVHATGRLHSRRETEREELALTKESVWRDLQDAILYRDPTDYRRTP